MRKSKWSVESIWKLERFYERSCTQLVAKLRTISFFLFLLKFPSAPLHSIVAVAEQEVTCVDFHPDASQQILVSGSKDYTIKFFDFSNPSVKKAQRSIPEASPIKTLHFHPSGNYLLVGTHHKTRRWWFIFTFAAH